MMIAFGISLTCAMTFSLVYSGVYYARETQYAHARAKLRTRK